MLVVIRWRSKNNYSFIVTTAKNIWGKNVVSMDFFSLFGKLNNKPFSFQHVPNILNHLLLFAKFLVNQQKEYNSELATKDFDEKGETVASF